MGVMYTKFDKRQKKIYQMLMILISIAIFGITVVLVSGDTKTNDYLPYSYNYYGIINSEFEAGYEVISSLFYEIGFSFDFFKLISFGFGFILMSATANKILPKYSLWKFYILYMIYPLTIDAAAIRNTLAM